jgi:HTH-type transcriptional regulator/antitoxin HigA
MAISREPRAQPDWIVPPGEILAEALGERAMTQAELSRRTARPLKTINEIIKGRSAITPDTALQFEYVLGISARFWLNVEREWQERLARERARGMLEAAASWSSKFPVKALSKLGLVPESASSVELSDALLRFFAVTSPEAWERQVSMSSASFRRARFKSDRYALAAWLRAGAVLAERIKTKPFDASAVRAALPRIRELTELDPLGFHDELLELLSSVGIALILLSEFGATRVYGASYWVSPDKAVIQLSGRGRKDDQFWFSLFHEIGHLLSGGIKRETRLELEERRADVEEANPEEVRANAFARETLVSNDVLAEFPKGLPIGEDQLRATAKRIRIAPGILLGRLQREGRLAWKDLSWVKRTITLHGQGAG